MNQELSREQRKAVNQAWDVEPFCRGYCFPRSIWLLGSYKILEYEQIIRQIFLKQENPMQDQDVKELYQVFSMASMAMKYVGDFATAQVRILPFEE